MTDPKYYPRLRLSEAITEGFIRPGENVVIYDARGCVAYEGTIEGVPENILNEYVNWIRGRLSVQGCKLNFPPTDQVAIDMLFVNLESLAKLSAAELMDMYDELRGTEFVNKRLRDEILRRLKNA